MQSNSVIWQSPSFETYSSSNTLATIAARVVDEFPPHSELDNFLSQSHHQQIFNHHNHRNHHKQHGEEQEGLKKLHDSKEEEDFEFTSISREDEIICSNQIKPTYPLFNTTLLLDNYDDVQFNLNSPSLRKHSNEEEHDHDLLSCSSSENDELDRIPQEMYCIWTPKKAENLPKSSKKGNSTSSSTSWKFRDIFYRSKTEGKESFVSLTSFNKKKKTTKGKKEAVRDMNAVASKVPMALEYSVLNGKVKERDRRPMYVPYMKDIVGMLANVNNVSKNVLPF